MRVLFSPVPGFSLPATQTKNVVPGGTAEGDASADFEGLLRSFMAGVQTDHGGQDILITCVDTLTGFGGAIGACYPCAEVQKCIVLQIRNSINYVS